MKKGKIIIFSAPSGSGKTTIVKHLLSLDIGLSFSISATSRGPRDNEQEGKDYFFLSPEEFKRKIAQEEFLEYEEVYKDQFYGTLRSEVEKMRKSGKHVLFDIDVVGGLNLKNTFHDDALAVFVQPPSLKIMEERLRGRGSDSEAQIQTRLAKAKKELEYAPDFDEILVNNKLEESLSKAEDMVRKFINS